MQSNFYPCLDITLRFEGGYSNDPNDPGGATLNGVTQRTYNAYRDKKRLSRQSVKLMDHAERDEIYYTGYWLPINGQTLPIGVDCMYFDGAVNSGVRQANRWFIQATPGTAPDIIRKYASARLSFLQGLRTWKFFGIGWGKRVATNEKISLGMYAASINTSTDVQQSASDTSKVINEITAQSINEATILSKKRKAQSKITIAVSSVPTGVSLHPATINSGEHLLQLILGGFVIIALIVLVLFIIESVHQDTRVKILGS